MAGMIQVEGLRDVDRALAELDVEVRTEMRGGLKLAAEPAQLRAASLAFEKISGMKRAVNSSWWEMRLGGGVYVYLAPASRRKRGSPRPNLAGLLMQKAMRPGLEQTAPAIAGVVGEVVDRALTKVGF